MMDLVKDDGEQADNNVIASRVIRRSQFHDLTEGEKRMCIYFLPSRAVNNDSMTREVMQIDVHMPELQDTVAYDIHRVINSLLHEKQIGESVFFLWGLMGEESTIPGFVCVGSRYYFYRVI